MLWLSVISLILWGYFFVARGRFWLANQRLPENNSSDSHHSKNWPDVVVIIPARNEASTVGITVRSLFAQKYPGKIRIIVVDDNSKDGTAKAAGDDPRLTVIAGAPLKPGWTGKTWALQQGIVAAGNPQYLLLSDADIEHSPSNVRQLVVKAQTDDLALVSLMVRLHCKSFWEKLLIPAFVYFFQKLYPFPWVNNPHCKIAAAAGGCMLIRNKTLQSVGGLQEIRDKIIDDCALSALLKAHSAIWLGLTRNVCSLRSYNTLSAIWRMVTRSAFVQLRYSSILLLGTVMGMSIVYLLPPLALVFGSMLTSMLAGSAWILMSVSFLPTIRLYDLPIWFALFLPIAGLFYLLMTLHSAFQHWVGQGALWKGRVYTNRSDC